MDFYKSVTVLKQVVDGFSCSAKPVSAIARIEFDTDVCQIQLSVLNLSAKSGGEFFLFILQEDGALFSYPLGLRPSRFSRSIEYGPNPKNGIAVGIVYVKDDLPLTVAFSRSDNSNLSLQTFKKAIADKCLYQRKNRKSEQALDCHALKTESTAQTTNDDATPCLYDDEAVATADYFELDRELKEKLSLVKEIKDECLPTENAMPNSECQDETKKSEQNASRIQDETCNGAIEKGAKIFNDKNPYYLTVKKELDSIFSRFEQDDCLKAYFKDSRWAKIYYRDNLYYIVGVIKEKGREKYVCYGVPSTYSPTPPKELNGFCSFIPRSVFDLKGEGFWMMFQDAVSGKCVEHPTQN